MDETERQVRALEDERNRRSHWWSTAWKDPNRTLMEMRDRATQRQRELELELDEAPPENGEHDEHDS